MKNKLLCIFAFFLPVIAFAQTGNIKGLLKDEAGNPIISTAVSIQGTTLQTLTDSTGAYELSNVPYGHYVILAGDDKNYTATENVEVNQPNVALNITARSVGLENISAGSADIPTLSLGDEDLKESTTSNVSSVLNASRDAFTSASTFTFSIARFRTRGYDSDNFPTLMNGAVLTDLANNRTEYNAWTGLNDVTRSRETTLGLAPTNAAFGEVGGLSVIDSRASQQRKQLQVNYGNSNRAYDNRIVITYGSGLTTSGWSYSVSYARRWANEGYIPGTFYDGHSFFGSVEKMINSKHSIALSAFAAKTKNGRSSPVVQELYDLAGTNYYNRNWGYQNGEKRNASVGDNFQPLFILTHDWTINEKSSLETALSFQTGKNKVSGIDWYKAQDPRPDYYRYLPSFDPSYGLDPAAAAKDSLALVNLYTSNPDKLQLDWNKMYDANQFGDTAAYVLSNSVTDAKRYGFNTTYNNAINENTTFAAGLSVQKQDINYYRQIQDMLGGNYFLNLNQFADTSTLHDPDVLQFDLNNPDRKLTEGDKYAYDYVAHIMKSNIWAQGIFKYDRIDYFLGVQLSMTSFYRTGNFRNGVFKDESYGDSKTYNFVNPGVKGGITYKMNGRNYIYVNGAYITRAPLFENTFVSPRTRSLVVDNLNSEKIGSVEGGYLYRAPKIKARATGYYTHFTDVSDTRSFYYDDLKTFVNYSLSGIDKRHVGIELSVDASLGKGFSATAVAAIGQFVYANRPLATITQDNKDTLYAKDATVYAQNLRVADGPQKAYTLGLNYRSKHYWYLNVNFNYFDDIYVDFNPVRRMLPSLEYVDEGTPQWEAIMGQEKRDGEFTLDFSGGWSWKLNNKFKSLKQNTFIVFNLGITNILDNTEITTTGFEQLRFDANTRDPNIYPTKYSYAFGRTYFAGVTFRFN